MMVTVQDYCTCRTGRRTIGSCIGSTAYIGLARWVGFHSPVIYLDDVIKNTFI